MCRTMPAGRSARILLALILIVCVRAAGAQTYYWENPRPLSTTSARFPSVISLPAGIVVIWQESEQTGADTREAFLSLALLRDGQPEILKRRFAGPYPFRGGEPVFYSAAGSPSGELALATLSGDRELTFMTSRDGGLTFENESRIPAKDVVSDPRIFPRGFGGWYLFSAVGQEQRIQDTDETLRFLTTYWSMTEDGKKWTSLSPFLAPQEGLPRVLLPALANGRDTDLVVFQALTSDASPSLQLFSKATRDGGKTWDSPVIVTGFEEPSAVRVRDYTAFENQRPDIAYIGGKFRMVWERRPSPGSGNIQAPSQVYYAELDDTGKYISGTSERVNAATGMVREPLLFDMKGNPAVVWFDNRRAVNRIFIGIREGSLWREVELRGVGEEDSVFGRALFRGGRLWSFWQSQLTNVKSSIPRIIVLAPDTSVAPPAVAAADFTPGRRVRRDSAALRWTSPEDSSGIAGYSYTWGRNPDDKPPETLAVLETVSRAAFEADRDGSWWFSIRAVDYAGNWSEPARVEFVRDTTPPGPPSLRPPEAAPDGFLTSNTFNVLWDPPRDPDVAGYSWTLRYIGPLDRLPARKRPPSPENEDGSADTPAVRTPSAAPYPFEPATDYERELAGRAGETNPPPSSRGPGTSAGFPNVDDGYYIFAVAAVDEVGNIGLPVRTLLRADKFVPFTLVSDVLLARDDFGVATIRILGRGFREDGVVSRVVLDRDGQAPYDFTFDLSAGAYSVESDRSLGGLVAQDVEEGKYRLGLLHPVRGWYWARSLLAFDAAGTVKFGDFSTRYEPTWAFRAPAKYRISFWDLFAVLAAAFGAVGILATLRKAALVIRDGALIRLEVAALLEGGPMPAVRKKVEVRKLKTRGLNLGFKFTLVIGLLVLLVTAMVSVPLGVFLVRTQGNNLASGLEQKARVLLESLVQGARTNLPFMYTRDNPDTYNFEKVLLQIKGLPDAQFATISGYGTGPYSADPDTIWVTNDPKTLKNEQDSRFAPGKTVLEDPLSRRIGTIRESIEARVREEIGSILETRASLQAEIEALDNAIFADEQQRQSLVARERPQPEIDALDARIREGKERFDQMDSAIADLDKTADERLERIAEESAGSEPSYDATALESSGNPFIFYKPIVYSRPNEDTYYRGMVRLAVSTDLINQELRSATVNLVRITGSIALLVLAVGVGGAALLAWYIVSPIRKLVAAIERIRDTEDKEQLKGERIEVSTRDELYELADAVNTLTEGLVKAAAASKDLTVGKETQKMFLPLHKNERGEKLSTGSEESPDVSFFGYYEGAKGVSGDFFNFLKLDDRYYAFIKCDAAGKGIPAAIISVEVATLFLNHFTGWTRDKGIHLDALAYQINDMVEGRGFKGKFAALTMGVLDGKTGTTHLCHAGDKTQRIYEARNRKIAVHDLPDTPPCGSFPNFLVEMKSPYTQTSLKLEKGDILLLYTDGIEEAKWFQRGPDFRILERTVTLKDGAEQIQKLEDDFGNDRAVAIVEAVLSRGRYRLVKEGNPLPDQVITFDYSSCEGTLEEVVLALISAEKLFRLYPDPRATEKDLVMVDAKIDDFLEKHFDQYRILLKDKRRENPDKDHPEYRVYAGIREDDQYDDLTLMAIKRK